jgi:hypothetical protein
MSQPTVLREEDYETIEAAVMETARGRWFLNEYARRNRSADTQIVLDAIAALEKKFDATPTPDHPAVSGVGEPAKQQILAAAEDVQEAAWALRELGANPDFCARLDRNATDISAICSSHDPGQEEFSGADALEEDLIDEASDAPPLFAYPKNPLVASTLIEAQSINLPESSLPQIQAKLATEWPAEENIAQASNVSSPAFSLSDYCFEEKIALFS